MTLHNCLFFYFFVTSLRGGVNCGLNTKLWVSVVHLCTILVGHSWVTGGLWAESGFDTFGINRINYMDLSEREANQDIEFIWKGSTSLGEDGYIFVHLLSGTYCTPGEIAFNNGDVFIQTDSSLPTFQTNYIAMAESFMEDVCFFVFLYFAVLCYNFSCFRFSLFFFSSCNYYYYYHYYYFIFCFFCGKRHRHETEIHGINTTMC